MLLSTTPLFAALDIVYVADNENDYEKFTERENALYPQWNRVKGSHRRNLMEQDKAFALVNMRLACAIHNDQTEHILKYLGEGAGDNKAYQIMAPIGVLPSTPLQHAAIFANKPASIQALADYGCDFKVLDCNGYNLLHLLCGANSFSGTIKHCYQKHNFDEIIKKFIICGVPTLLCDYEGDSPLDTLAKTYNGLFESSWPFKPKLDKKYSLENAKRAPKNCAIGVEILTYVNDSTEQEIKTAFSYIRSVPMHALQPYIGSTLEMLAFKTFLLLTPKKNILRRPCEILPEIIQEHILSFLISPDKLKLKAVRNQNQAQRNKYSSYKKFCPIPQPMWFERKKEKKLDQPEQKENSSTTCCIQ